MAPPRPTRDRRLRRWLRSESACLIGLLLTLSALGTGTAWLLPLMPPAHGAGWPSRPGGDEPARRGVATGEPAAAAPLPVVLRCTIDGVAHDTDDPVPCVGRGLRQVPLAR